MDAVAVTFLLLAPVLGHQVIGHRLLRRRTEPTRHELAHASRSRSVRLAANVAWLAYLLIVVTAAVLWSR
jgi:hypothetical protein